MSKVSLELIQKLRERTGVGMMDCRKALEEAGGDLEEAVTILRKKGVAVAAKRSENPTENGIVEGFVNDQYATLVEISCETDFSAKTDAMRNFAKTVAQTAASDFNNIEELMLKATAQGSSVQQHLDDLIAKICESIKVSKAETIKFDSHSVVSTYIHPDNSVGCIVELNADRAIAPNEKEKIAALAKDLCMQVAVTNPIAVGPESISAETLAREQETAKALALQSGKPEQFWDKIIDGKMRKFYSEVCLTLQPFIKDDSVTVQSKIDQLAKEFGISKLVLKKFARIGIKR